VISIGKGSITLFLDKELSNLYNNDITCIDYDEIINMLKVVIQKNNLRKKGEMKYENRN